MRKLITKHGKYKLYRDVERKYWNMGKSEIMIVLGIATIAISILITQYLEIDLLSWGGNLIQMK